MIIEGNTPHMTIYTLILFDDDGVISHMEHFSTMPHIGPNFFISHGTPNYALYEGNINGGDTRCISSYEPDND